MGKKNDLLWRFSLLAINHYTIFESMKILTCCYSCVHADCCNDISHNARTHTSLLIPFFPKFEKSKWSGNVLANVRIENWGSAPRSSRILRLPYWVRMKARSTLLLSTACGWWCGEEVFPPRRKKNLLEEKEKLVHWSRLFNIAVSRRGRKKLTF